MEYSDRVRIVGLISYTMDKIDSMDYYAMTETKELSALQRKALATATLNQEWLQWFMEDTLSNMPGFIAASVRMMAKKQLGLEREDLWKLVPIVIHGVDARTFDNFCDFLREFLE
jgi:hypothetical protein